MYRKKMWKGQVVPALRGDNGWPATLSQHAGWNLEQLKLANKFERVLARDNDIRKLFLLWRKHTTMYMAQSEYQLFRIRVEFKAWREEMGKDWLKTTDILIARYFSMAREEVFNCRPIRISFSGFWVSRWSLLESDDTSGCVVLYGTPSRLTADDVRGEGECAIEMAQREGCPIWSRQILDLDRRIAVGLIDEPKT